MQNEAIRLFNRQTRGRALMLRLKREAKRLHRSARSETTVSSLPVLRRLISNAIIRDTTLPQLFRDRASVQRKHLLALLATEAGFENWSQYKAAIESDRPLEELEHYSVVLRSSGYPNLWFNGAAEASDYAAENGGRAVTVGSDAVVVP